MRTDLLLRPFFVIALTTLIVNDHYFKSHYPGWLTGKLSDFAGLAVLAVFTTGILHRWLNSKRAIGAIHVMIGVAFVFWKLSPLEVPLQRLYSLISLPLPGKTADPSDLLALLILPISCAWCVAVTSERSLSWGPSKRIGEMGLITLAALAMLATTLRPREYVIRTQETIPNQFSVAESLWNIEEGLRERGIKTSNILNTERYSYVFEIERVADSFTSDTSATNYSGRIFLRLNEPTGIAILDSLRVSSYSRSPDTASRLRGAAETTIREALRSALAAGQVK